MNRPVYGCLTCPKDECDGCTTILATREETAMLRCGIPGARVCKKKMPAAAVTAPSDKKDLHLQYNTTQGGFTT